MTITGPFPGKQPRGRGCTPIGAAPYSVQICSPMARHTVRVGAHTCLRPRKGPAGSAPQKNTPSRSKACNVVASEAETRDAALQVETELPQPSELNGHPKQSTGDQTEHRECKQKIGTSSRSTSVGCGSIGSWENVDQLVNDPMEHVQLLHDPSCRSAQDNQNDDDRSAHESQNDTDCSVGPSDQIVDHVNPTEACISDAGGMCFSHVSELLKTYDGVVKQRLEELQAKMPPPPGLFYNYQCAAAQPVASVKQQHASNVLGSTALEKQVTMMAPPPGIFIAAAPSARESPAMESAWQPADAMLPTGIAEPQLIAALPSIGSAKHFEGACRPCAFIHKHGCANGANCSHCHLCPPNEKHRRRLLKRGLPWKLVNLKAVGH